MEMEDSFPRVHHDLVEQLLKPLCLGGELPVEGLFTRKSGVQIHHIQALVAVSVGEYDGITNQRVYPPRLRCNNCQ